MRGPLIAAIPPPTRHSRPGEQRWLSLFALFVTLLSVGSRAALAQESPPDPLQLTLPPVAYASAGIATHVFFDNVVLTETPARYRFEVQCELGEVTDRCWRATPSDEQVGDHAWELRVYDGQQLLAQDNMILRVTDRQAGRDRELRVLIVGDSLTHASIYPRELARLLDGAEGLRVTLLGSHRPLRESPHVAHEGYGGWTWKRFLEHFEEGAESPPQRSPFVYWKDGQRQLDVAQYITDHCAARPPDLAVFLLGINDCFAADPDDPAQIEARVDQVLAEAEILLAAFRAVAPQCGLAVCVVPPPNARESGFEANYQGRYHRWGWKRIQHRLAQRQIERFSEREDERIFMVPLQLNIDPLDGYPVDNGVHPNPAGYGQIAATLSSWIRDYVSRVSK